ncbi:heavy metal translocating P-type ATPase [Allobaculum stercoricanis]|uniref:heavy metal translocating P-type ATPase n=1 Tax=Allobaculum stercoricanis TaxID=174709 RepID=UPI00248EE374|nr:heavy metal translocating P-type ATPase [Allobaculum stercoricanis]
MTKKQKKNLKRILISAACYFGVTISSLWITYPPLVLAGLYLLIYLYIASDVLKRTVMNIRNKDFMDENFLMAVASIGAFCLQEYSEAVAVMLFYQVGEWFQSYALDRSRKNIAALMDIRPEYANLEKEGSIEEVDPEEVKTGDIIVIKPGERVPLDGVILSGTSSMDTSALTGESVPRSVRPGQEVISGCINETGVLRVEVSRPYENSTVARILEMVENATDKKSRSEQFITKFAAVYTPIVVYSAIALAIVPSLFDGQWSTWIYRALEFLVISCPCALVISVPLAFFGGIGGASKCGVLVKGSTYLQDLSEVKTMVFDKTGTLTHGTFEVSKITALNMSEEALLTLVAKAESYSTHPIASSILRKAQLADPKAGVQDVQEIAGKGLIAQVDGQSVAAGNQKLMVSLGIDEANLIQGTGLGTMVHVAIDGQYAGMIEVADQPKAEAKEVFANLRKEGVNKFVMLTGDSQSVAQAVAKQAGIDEVHAQLLPEQKVECLEQILDSEHQGAVVYVGDGINDAPVLTRADVGIAMGGLGSDAAIEAADIVLMEDKLSALVTAMKISQKTLHIAKENIVFALVIKVGMLILGAFGFVNMWGAVFADVGVSVLCILNAIRVLNVSKFKTETH